MYTDLRYALRQLCNNPGFTAVAALTLALGIGANVAIFSVVNAVLLRPLPYPDPDKIVSVSDQGNFLLHLAESTSDPLSWQSRVSSFTAAAGYQAGEVNLGGDGEPERLHVAQVTPAFFEVMGVNPTIGRDLSARDGISGHEIVLSWDLWQRRYGGQAEIVGKTVSVNGLPVTVVGVMPWGFEFPAKAVAWVASGIGADTIYRGVRYLVLIARLRPNVSLAQAQAEMTATSARFRHTGSAPSKPPVPDIRLLPLQETLVMRSRLTLLLLFGAAGFVLLIACVNLTHLTLTRAIARRKEVALRSALGASRHHLTRQFLVDHLLLAGIGGGAGLLIASWSRTLLLAVLPTELPSFSVVEIDSTVVVFTLGLAVIAALSCGLVTAFSITKVDLISFLKEGSVSLAGHGLTGSGGGLFIVQVALCFALLTGAGLMVRTLVRLLSVNPGFSTEQVLTLDVLLPVSKYSQPAQMRAYFDEVLERLGSTPGVLSAAGIDHLPLGGSAYFRLPISTAQVPNAPDNDPQYWPAVRVVTRDYFQTLRVPLLQGRPFNRYDGPESKKVAIVNESLSRRFWPGQSAVGQRFRAFGDVYEVVGEVGDVRHDGLRQRGRVEFYVPHEQSPRLAMNLVVRTSGITANEIRRQILAVDEDQPISEIHAMESVVTKSVASERSLTFLLSTFSLLALLLAAVGCYGIMAYSVGQRVREIGVRMALGASRSSILHLVLHRGLTLTFVGLFAGLLSALALTRLLTNVLFEVSPLDPAAFICGGLTILAVVLAACYFPARRATKVDPMVALRCE